MGEYQSIIAHNYYYYYYYYFIGDEYFEIFVSGSEGRFQESGYICQSRGLHIFQVHTLIHTRYMHTHVMESNLSVTPNQWLSICIPGIISIKNLVPKRWNWRKWVQDLNWNVSLKYLRWATYVCIVQFFNLMMVEKIKEIGISIVNYSCIKTVELIMGSVELTLWKVMSEGIMVGN